MESITPANVLNKFKKRIAPPSKIEEEKKNNELGILALILFILSIAIIPIGLILGLPVVTIITITLLSLILFYAFTFASFNEMRKKEFKNEKISTFNFIIISILYTFFATVFPLVFAFVLADLPLIAIALIIFAVALLSIFIYKSLVQAYGKYKISRKQ
jgi:amino acid transporter